MKINRNFFRYFAYTLEILIFYVLQGTPTLIPELFGSKPLLLIPIALTIASKENQIPSLIFGAVCGALTDIASSGGVGFFAVMLTLVCYIEAEIFKKYIVPSFVSTALFSAVAVSVLICLYFLIFKLIAGIPECGVLFVNHYISRIVYTFITVVPFYFLNKYLNSRLLFREYKAVK